MKMLLSEVCEPWSFDDIKESYFKNFFETESIIDKTEGGQLWKEIINLNESVYVLDSCTSDLLDVINDFAHQTTKNGFWNRLNRPQEELYTRKVKKYIFCTTSAAMALVDHSRNFNKKYPCMDFKKKREEGFGDSGIHDFIQNLRNYFSHWRMAEANWEISFSENYRDVKFILKRNELLYWDGWSVQAKKYIESIGEKIDVYELFKKYNDITSKLYEWHKYHILATRSEILNIYFKYKKYLNQIKEQTSWNLILSYIPTGKDPYEYLSEYLTNDQIEEIFSFGYKTTEQVDRLIELLDLHSACDTKLRAKIYEKLLK
jgi:hypothetical protein